MDNLICNTSIGVDLGTTTGVAWASVVDNTLTDFRATTVNLLPDKLHRSLIKGAPKALRNHDPRSVYLWSLLKEVVESTPGPHYLTFEDVKFSSTTYQSQLWGTLRGAMWLVPVDYFFAVPTNLLKKFATGHGGARKELMDSYFLRSFDGGDRDDNLVDAMFALCYGAEQVGINYNFSIRNQWTRITTNLEQAIKGRLSLLKRKPSKPHGTSPRSLPPFESSTHSRSKRTRTTSRTKTRRLS